MLKKIPKNISPELLKILMEMGHGDEIVISDGNFPAHSISQNVVHCDGMGVREILDSILELFPLDTKYSKEQVFYMEVVPGDDYVPEIWDDYKKIIDKHEENVTIGYIERFKFYERAKKAYAVIHTSESALYANVILKKGVV
ncbi:MAG: RbsD/FucU domain-containing protein [Peptoniphilaceae bacterium]|nr:fucose isomerase [Peptoniphilaceae bacterium]MDD7382893.1 RbsD/FucU domain-containing protein [Peptoniphilaceae bacterium]MDY3737968.1 RbsD/FucU domain-containing protein [Peptoniphilaceae bacterium]